MKARLIFACAAAGIALSAFGATTASAEGDSGTLQISPGVVRPGESVSLEATCNDPDFTVPAPVESGALVPTELTGKKGADGVWLLSATTTVNKDVKPGSWSALFQCGPEGNVVVGNFEVVGPLPRAEIIVTPAQGKPGATVDIEVVCDQEVTITSPALNISQVAESKKSTVSRPLLGATATVKDVKPGVYDVSTQCNKKAVSTKFTVLGAAAAPEKKPQVPVKPKGAADTGSLDVAPAPEQNTGLYVLGGSALAALGAAGGVGAWAYRRRQRA